MILCGVMARVDITTAKIRSCICMGSGLYLEGGQQRSGQLVVAVGGWRMWHVSSQRKGSLHSWACFLRLAREYVKQCSLLKLCHQRWWICPHS